jgi:hypothetical protein
MFDPTFALYVEKEGIPLNAYEIRDAWFRHGGEDLEFVFGADRERFRGGDMPVVRAHFEGYGDLAFTEKTLNKYAYLGYLPNTNLMTAPKDYLMMFITKDELCDAKPWHKRDAPEHPESEPYFPLGQVALTMTPGEGKTVEVQLQTMTPNFETFRARIDGGAWSDSGDRIVWPPHDGINRLDAVSANWFGVEGPLSAVELEVLQ